MKMLIFALLLPSLSIAMGKLDELVDKSSKLREEGVKGFIYQQAPKQVQLTAPEELFNNEPEPESEPVHPGNWVSQREHFEDIKELDANLRELERDIAKISVVLENLQAKSETHSDSLNTAIKLIELLIGVVTLAGAGGGIIISRRK